MLQVSENKLKNKHAQHHMHVYIHVLEVSLYVLVQMSASKESNRTHRLLSMLIVFVVYIFDVHGGVD